VQSFAAVERSRANRTRPDNLANIIAKDENYAKSINKAEIEILIELRHQDTLGKVRMNQCLDEINLLRKRIIEISAGSI
jgi:hypothetical protein